MDDFGEKCYSLYFAPLQGFTDAVYRNAHRKVFGNVDAYYTPFLRLEKNEFRSRDIKDVVPDRNTVEKLIPQIMVGSPEEFRKIVSFLFDKGYREMDINLGCPFPMLVKRHKGAGMFLYPEEVKNLLSAILDFPSVAFSLKMRLGWDDVSQSLDLLPFLNDLPFLRIALHARLGIQQYKGVVKIENFGAFYSACKHPLVYNGDILRFSDIEKITTLFPDLEGVMIGRGLLADPALAFEYRQKSALTSEEKLQKIEVFHSILLDGYASYLQGESQLLSKMKVHWEYLCPDMEKKRKKAILKAVTMEKYNTAVREALKI